MKCRYLHTLNGKPATFDGECICYAGGRTVVETVPTLNDIRRQQRQSRAFFKKNPNITEWHRADYGYCRVS